KLLEHIDNCLLCRCCERVCPAEVPYGKLIDDFRSRLLHRKRSSFQVRLLKNLAVDKRLNRTAQQAMRIYRHSGLQSLARKTGLARLARINRIDRLLPDSDNSDGSSFRDYYPAPAARGRVGLFKGCLGEMLDPVTVRSAVEVLNRCGYDVAIPTEQTCCGALHLHEGDIPAARALAEKNIRAFSDSETPLDAVLTLASGCGGALKEYPALASGSAGFSGKITDISEFLSTSPGLDEVEPLPLNARVGLHTPCTLRNVMREEQGALRLIRRIPGCRTVPFPESLGCCGSAGSYMLEHPEMAQSLLGDYLKFIGENPVDFLASSNIGCMLHLRAGLRAEGSALEVVHPVVLLARQLRAV
ncbi:MAG: (Fe-S)-binding protein, partial [Gammaproteobacteria bacterium]